MRTLRRQPGKQEEAAAFKPFDVADFETPDNAWEVQPSPARLPHDLEPGSENEQHFKVPLWFGPPSNAWYVGTVMQVNKRRKKSENVATEFHDEKEGTMVLLGATLWPMQRPTASARSG